MPYRATLRIDEVEAWTKLSRDILCTLISFEKFPTPITLADRSPAFLESKVQEWLDQQKEEIRKAAPARTGREDPRQDQLKTTILRISEVKHRTGLSRTAIYDRMLKGDFPAPVSLGGRAVGWVDTEVQGWIETQIKETRKTNPQDRYKKMVVGVGK